MKKFLKDNKWNILFVSILTIAIYSYKLLNYSFSIDTEVMINNPHGQMVSWMITGRWSLYLTKFVFHLIPINITLTNVLAVIFLILNSVIWTYYLESISSIKDYKYNWIFMSAIVSSPILCEQIGFTLQAFEIVFGFFVLAIAMILIENWRKNPKHIPQLVGAVLIVTYCFGLYQSFVFMFVFSCILSFVLIYENKGELEVKSTIIDILKYIGIFVVSFILFEIISKLVLNYLHAESSSYLANQILWGQFPKLYIITNIAKSIFNLIIGKNALYHYFLIIFMVIFFVRYCFNKNNNNAAKVFKVIVVLAFYAMPFSLNILIGGNVAVRTLFVLCYLNAFLLWHVMLKEKSKILMIVVVISLLMPSGITFLLNRSAVNCYHEELKMANQITEMIKEKNYQDKKVIFIGQYNPNQKRKGEMLGASFFEWDYVTEYQCNNRIHGFFEASGLNYKSASIEEMNKIIPQVGSLKSWQEKKQIYLIDDVVVIKLS